MGDDGIPYEAVIPDEYNTVRDVINRLDDLEEMGFHAKFSVTMRDESGVPFSVIILYGIGETSYAKA